MEDFEPTVRTRLRRLPKRGSYERDAVYRILDEGLICHVGFVAGGEPFVIPTGYARAGDDLYVHGSAASRMLRTLAAGVRVCVTVTLLDGLVLARSAFHHSMNYRSVVVFGTATVVEEPAEKLEALRAFTEHMIPGRWEEVRAPDERELRQTLVLRLPLAEASAKVRTGPPVDDEEDYGLPVWAGELPLRLSADAPVPDPRLAPGSEPPPRLRLYSRAAPVEGQDAAVRILPRPPARRSGTAFAKACIGGFIHAMSAPVRIKRLRPGDDTDTYCGRCKAERMHQVVALNADGAPATVICRTCGGQHRYHEKKDPNAAPAARGAGRRARASAEPAPEAPAGPARPYSPNEIYAEGEWVEHPKFGRGKVAQARGGKIEVRFESASRLLLHAG